MPPSSPSSLNPFAASFIPPNKSLLQPHASSSACDVASLASLFSPLISSNISSFSLEHLVLAVISAFAHGVRCSTVTSSTPPQIPSPISHSSPESPSPSLSPSPIPIPVASSKFEFSALQGVPKSTVSGHPLIAPTVNTTNTNTVTLRASPKPAQTQPSSPQSSSSSESPWKTVSPKRQSHSRAQKSAVSLTLNTIPESKSIPLKNSFAALATECEQPESKNTTLPLPLPATVPVPVPVPATVTVPTQAVQPDRLSASITLNTNCSNALVEKKDNSAAQTSHSPSSSPSPSSSSSSSSSSPSVKFNPELSNFDEFPLYTNSEMLKIPLGQLRFELKQIDEHLDDYKYWLKENRAAFTKEQLEHHSKQLLLLSKYQSEVNKMFYSRWKAEAGNVAR